MPPRGVSPELMAESLKFRASSGNYPAKVGLLGEEAEHGGFHVSWYQKPTQKDMDEFMAWFRLRFPDYSATGYMGPQGAAEAAYKRWLKEIQGDDT